MYINNIPPYNPLKVYGASKTGIGKKRKEEEPKKNKKSNNKLKSEKDKSFADVLSSVLNNKN